MGVIMVLGYVAIAMIAVLWVFHEDSRKRRNALKTRPRPTKTSAPISDTVAASDRAHATLKAQDPPADTSDLSQGAA